MKYTYETRGALKTGFSTCKQPSADEVARAKARDKKQERFLRSQCEKGQRRKRRHRSPGASVITGKKPQTPEELAMNRCISSGRLPASWHRNAMLGAFTEILTRSSRGR